MGDLQQLFFITYTVKSISENHLANCSKPQDNFVKSCSKFNLWVVVLQNTAHWFDQLYSIVAKTLHTYKPGLEEGLVQNWGSFPDKK